MVDLVRMKKKTFIPKSKDDNETNRAIVGHVSQIVHRENRS